LRRERERDLLYPDLGINTIIMHYWGSFYGQIYMDKLVDKPELSGLG
jgi:hypothetical protein